MAFGKNLPGPEARHSKPRPPHPEGRQGRRRGPGLVVEDHVHVGVSSRPPQHCGADMAREGPGLVRAPRRPGVGFKVCMGTA